MNSLGKNIKYLRKKEKYNQGELASIIGVSQTSVAHYEASTRQPTIDTLMELSQLFNEPMDALVGNILVEETGNKMKLEEPELIEILVDSLVSKDENLFMESMNTSVYPFYNIFEIFDKILKKVMYEFGTLWEKGSVSEADEHYATNIIRKVITHIELKYDSIIKNKKSISFTVGTEKHTLGLEMVNTWLKSEGFDSLYLGSNLPVKSLEKVIDEYKPNYIFISITMSDSMNSLVQLINYINEKYDSELIIGVGGQGLEQNSELVKHKNLHIFENMKELKELIYR